MNKKLFIKAGIFSVVAILVYLISFYLLAVTQIMFAPSISEFAEVFYAPIGYVMKSPAKISLRISGYKVDVGKSYSIDPEYNYANTNHEDPIVGIKRIYAESNSYEPSKDVQYFLDSKEVSAKEFYTVAELAKSEACDEMGRPDLFTQCDKKMLLGGFEIPKDPYYHPLTFTKAKLQSYKR